MKVGSLFSGVGVMDLGLRNAEWEIQHPCPERLKV